jgi:acetoin utilization protein AcuB
MTIDQIMSRDVVCVAPDTTLMEIRKLLHERGFHHLIVLDEDDVLVGVISDRDVLRVISPFLDTLTESHRDVRTLSRPASDIMRTDPITAHPDMPITDAATRLLDNDISSLPVVDEDDHLCGIVTSKDLLRYYTDVEGEK